MASERLVYGGRGGIRTHGTLAGTPVFKTGALNHSATLPFNSGLRNVSRLAQVCRSRNGERDAGDTGPGQTLDKSLEACVLPLVPRPISTLVLQRPF